MRGKLIDDVRARFDPGPLYLTWPTVAHVTTTERFVRQVALRWERGAEIILEALKLLEEERQERESPSEEKAGRRPARSRAKGPPAGDRRGSTDFPGYPPDGRADRARRTLARGLSSPPLPRGHSFPEGVLHGPGVPEVPSESPASSRDEAADIAAAAPADANGRVENPGAPDRVAPRDKLRLSGASREGFPRSVQPPLGDERRERPRRSPEEPCPEETPTPAEGTGSEPAEPPRRAASFLWRASQGTPPRDETGIGFRGRPAAPGVPGDTWPPLSGQELTEPMPSPEHTLDTLLTERLRREAALREWEETGF